MPVLQIPPALRYYVDNHRDLEVSAVSINDLLTELVGRYPTLVFHLLDAEGKLRRHFSVFVNGENIRELKGVDTMLKPEDQVILLVSAAGG